MLHEPKTIHVEPGSALDHVLDEASEAPVILTRNRVRYRARGRYAPDRSPMKYLIDSDWLIDVRANILLAGLTLYQPT